VNVGSSRFLGYMGVRIVNDTRYTERTRCWPRALVSLESFITKLHLPAVMVNLANN